MQSYVTLYRAGWRAEPGKDIIMSMWLYFTGSPKMNQCPLAAFVGTQTEKMIPAFKCNLASRVFSPELSLEHQWEKVFAGWWNWRGLSSHPGSSVHKSSWHFFWFPQWVFHPMWNTQRPGKMSSVKDMTDSVKPASLIPWKENSHAVQSPGTSKNLWDCSTVRSKREKVGTLQKKMKFLLLSEVSVPASAL